MIKTVSSLVASIAVCLLLVWSIWQWLGEPVSMVDAPSGKVHCMSYTPFRGSDTPFNPAYVASPGQIEEDLALLSKSTSCIRLYSPGQGLDHAVVTAEKDHMQVLLGAWIGRVDADNEKEIGRVISLARSYPETVRAIIVGNEVLLRNEQSASTLAALARRVRAETGKPVTYADVTDFWLKAPQDLADSVDFLTVHILPFWEDHPRSAADGVALVDEAVEQIHARFPGKPILIGETGFPGKGRQRGPAIPSLVSEALYLRSFMVWARDAGIDYNLIEAFDQPWKRALEGTVGGNWGIYDEAREAKFPWQGPVSNQPHWRLAAAASLVIALSLTGFCLLARVRGLPLVVVGALAAIASVFVVLQAQQSLAAYRNLFEAIVELYLMAQTLACLLLLLPQIARGRSADAPAPLAAVAQWCRVPQAGKWSRSMSLGLLHLSVLASTLVCSLGLAFDPRYADFPLAAFTVPAAGFLVLAILNVRRIPGPLRREEALLVILGLSSAAISMLGEGLENGQAVRWALLVLAILAPFAGTIRDLFARAR
ncbi:MAG: hypothetical protein PW790_04605 [Parvibaculaceae bacterium]|nr:hypothetical protein [Parvibaculaceae bacterium]